MKIFFRLLILVILALLGGLVFSFTVNILIMAKTIPTENLSGAFGHEMTQRAVFVWMGSFALGLIGLFMQSKWRFAFFVLPLIAPSLYAVLYGMSLN